MKDVEVDEKQCICDLCWYLWVRAVGKGCPFRSGTIFLEDRDYRVFAAISRLGYSRVLLRSVHPFTSLLRTGKRPLLHAHRKQSLVGIRGYSCRPSYPSSSSVRTRRSGSCPRATRRSSCRVDARAAATSRWVLTSRPERTAWRSRCHSTATTS